MTDLNDLRVFERVATLESFSAAARALRLPKSSVSRSIARLETDLGVRLIQRTTREMALTSAGAILKERLVRPMDDLARTLAFVGGLGEVPRGRIRISCGIAFGINVVATRLPEFLARFPEIDVSLELDSRNVDLVAEGIDIAIRIAPLRDSSLVATQLGTMNRYLCAAPAYLEGREPILAPRDIRRHQTIELPDSSGRTQPWLFTRGEETVRHDEQARVSVNEVMTIEALVLGGAGVGVLSAFQCGQAILDGRLVRLLPGWSLPVLPVSLIFPSRRELAPAVRVFADFMKQISSADAWWRDDKLAT